MHIQPQPALAMRRKKPSIRILIYTLPPMLILCGPAASAAPQAKPPTIEERVEIHSTNTHEMPAPAKPAEPVTFLGVEVEPVDEALAAQLKLPAEHGLVVRYVVPDSPAAAAGVQRHDVLTRLDDQLLIEPRQLAALVRSHQAGDTVRLTYMRAGAEARATASLTRRVPPQAASLDTLRWIGEGPMAPAQFVYRAGAAAPRASVPGHRFTSTAPHGGGTPRVMVFRPTARIVYTEDEVTLEVTTNEHGRHLEARGADGEVLFQGPVNTPEQRAAVPEPLQKHLEKLDALEPNQLQAPTPAAPVAPPALPAPPPAVSRECDLPETAPAC